MNFWEFLDRNGGGIAFLLVLAGLACYDAWNTYCAIKWGGVREDGDE